MAGWPRVTSLPILSGSLIILTISSVLPVGESPPLVVFSRVSGTSPYPSSQEGSGQPFPWYPRGPAATNKQINHSCLQMRICGYGMRVVPGFPPSRGVSDMCGIIGIINSPNVQYDIYNGLITLQHRGQESAGILTTDGRDMFIHRGAGLVKDIFNRDILKIFGGTSGIGQVRYPTVGVGVRRDDRSHHENILTITRNAQPSFDHHPGLATVHNGNIVNYWELRDDLRARRRYPNSDCDVDVMNKILGILLKERAPDWNITAETVFESIRDLMKRLKGSYSALSMIHEVGFVAYRDPHGIRPFVHATKEVEVDGRKQVSYGFASETVALDALGYRNVRDIEPGEAVFIPFGGEPVSRIVADHPRPAHCQFEWIYFSRPSSSIEHRNVYLVRLNLGRELAKIISAKGIDVDIVSPVPDTSRPTALNLARKLGKPFMEIFDKNRYAHRSFILPDETARKNEIKFKLTPIIHEIRDRSILVVDDSIVRGPTSRKVVQILRESGARAVHFAISCPPLTHRCYLGIDMVSEQELIASRMGGDVERIRKEIGADSLTYLPLESMKESIGMGDNICVGCLTGCYPVEVSEKEKQMFETRRYGDEYQTRIHEY